MNEKFTVIFYNEDRKMMLEKQDVNKGDCVKYQGKLPEKPAENGIEYTFIGWETTDGDMTNVVQDMEIFAKYEETAKINSMFELTQLNAQNAKLDNVMRGGTKN